MPPRAAVPDVLRHRPFHIREALLLGVSERRLRGKAWRSLLPRVWVHVDHVMTEADWVVAARLAMPEQARLSHITRLQQLGLDFGTRRPFHFTMAGDRHLEVASIFLHRTAVLPPVDDVGLTPAAAYIQFCADARMIDAIKVGDWLLHRRHMSATEVAELAERDPWRPGSREVLLALPHLDGRARSLPESETRAILVFSGLPKPEVNHDIFDDHGTFLGCGDLVYVLLKLLVEYEGRQHLLTVDQWNTDIDRYGGLRDHAWTYVQVTNEKIAHPRKLVAEVYRQLVQVGYTGPAPTFGPRWSSLFAPITPNQAVMPRKTRGSRRTVSGA